MVQSLSNPATPLAVDADIIDALQIAFVVIAAERGALTKSHACNTLGMTPQEYDLWRRQAISIGRSFAQKMMAARGPSSGVA